MVYVLSVSQHTTSQYISVCLAVLSVCAPIQAISVSNASQSTKLTTISVRIMTRLQIVAGTVMSICHTVSHALNQIFAPRVQEAGWSIK